MSIVIGRKYKVDKQKLQMLCVKYNWVYKECCDYVTPVCVSKYVSQRFNSITFSIKENHFS